ncbi:MAG TPA: hypothetical protein VFK94_06240, partial [Patescibacteria group bacterium]|nr:hypothetical protein [Patescibacteria group bacterium]
PINNAGRLSPGNYYIFANESSARGDGSLCGSATFTVKTACYSEATSPTVKEDFCGSGYSARAIPDEGGSPDVTTYHCECIPSSQLPTFNSPSNNTSGSTSHGQGFGGTNYCKDGTKGVDTALGCLPSDPGKLANVLFSIALGIAGAIAIIMIIIGGFKVAASQGNVDALQDGKDTITKAITGLVFILLATTILGIIGIDILGIPFFRRDGAGIIINQR